ncbi:BQ5605_C018g08736 [Microbotryum silenes-dioicae]|uniref:BQ5605_C018g08736 protein n=1 Tax=Microbotryum silenes-dioicae TaxID=796604 RepID=A0A2X0P0I5_9BASI|nr:BQ5605_C018g08736 [Microbotryum silenes-dioicae]
MIRPTTHGRLLFTLPASGLAGPLARVTYTPAQLHLIRQAHRMYPSQFSFVRTIDDTKFETLLLQLREGPGVSHQHPDCALVRSFVHGFRSEGFEPEHNGSVASGDNPVTLTFPHSEDHRSFIQTTIDVKVAKGWLSPGTAFPIPGATYSPVFVVESANHRMRVVADHTRSGLNDGISCAACPTVYNSIIDFIRLLRWHRFATSLLSANWKLDVSSAFKVLVMSKDWQARQGIAIRCQLPDGALVTWYHIEWRGVFGCCAMPFLWTRFMSLVVWIAHHSYGIEHPLAYMDDAFGADIEGRLVPFVHNGETHVIPLQQARMATLRSSLGLPFKLTPDKAPFGRRVTITGIYCDLDDFSISLTPKAVNDLATAIQAFLDFPGRCPPLRQWRQMTGWLSWALNIAPQARPHVTPLYNKIGTKTRPNAGVPINLEVREALTSIAHLLAATPKLDLNATSLTRWSLSDADLVIYTDACLHNNDDTGAGLGFWFASPGQCHYFTACPGRSYKCIQFVEALTVVVALDLATLGAFGSFRRVLVRTDSAPAVYALDLGACSDTKFLPLRTLTLRAFATASSRRFDLKVQHVAGKLNTTADDLSRDAVMTPTTPGVGRGVSFASRPLPGPRLHMVHPLADDIAFSDEFVARALEPCTRSDYQRSLRQWIAYVMGQWDMGYAIDCYPTVSTLRAFIAHRYRSVTAVHQTLSGLAHWFGPLMGSEWKEVRSNRLVRAAIVGGQKLWRHAPVRAKPLPFDMLSTTLRRARSDPLLVNNHLCFLAMLALGFSACASSGELTLPDTIRFRDADKLPSRDSVVVSKTGFRVRLPYHKADRRWRGSFLQVVTRATGPHFIDVLSLFLAARDFRFRTMGVGAKLFLTSSRVPPTRNWFITWLHAEFGREYSGHSLRSGGATHYAILGFLPAEIQRIGRWKSAAWEEYVRISPDLNMALLARW